MKGRFQYIGQACLPEIGLSYTKARIYSPRIGRLLQTDPIGSEDQVNFYAYVGKDLVNLNDFTGIQSCVGTTAYSTFYASRGNDEDYKTVNEFLRGFAGNAAQNRAIRFSSEVKVV